MADRIMLRGLAFYGYHGVLAEETRLGQRFLLDLEMEADLRLAGQTDDLTKTIDYGAVYADVKAIVEGPPLKLIEALAERVASHLLQRYPMKAVVVRVHKPGAPVPGPLDMVTVEIRRDRQE